MPFTGIPAEAFEFYEALDADNSKAFWTAHKGDYERYVRDPLAALGQDLSADFGEPKLFRPYRDVRFSKDKTPIKDHQGLYVLMRNSVGWYVQVSAAGLMVAGGWYESAPNQIAAYREAVDHDRSNALGALVAGTAKKGFTIGGDQLKTRPQGTDPEHPRLELLRYKTLYAERRWEPQAWMGTRRALSRVKQSWEDLTPLMSWFADHIPAAEGRDRR
ncbi:MAG: DUF2461 domain-containing protein [Candidatus Nanopelagicales bacterium]